MWSVGLSLGPELPRVKNLVGSVVTAPETMLRAHSQFVFRTAFLNLGTVDKAMSFFGPGLGGRPILCTVDV